MFSKLIAVIIILTIHGPVSAEEVKSRPALLIGNVEYSSDLNEPIVWEPTVDRLSRYTLTLPRHGIQEAIKYSDTAPLFYLSHVNDRGVSLQKEEQGTFYFHVDPTSSRLQYRYSLSPALSLSLGVNYEKNNITPLITGEFRSVSNTQALHQGSLVLSGPTSNVLLSRTQLNMTESHEKIWVLFINQNLSRLSYGLRWFEVVPRTNLVGEFSISSEDPALAFQLERSFINSAGYIGISMTTVTEKAELFLGVHFNFANSTKVDVTSGSHLLTNSAQTLSAQRRIALPYLWRNHFRILDKW